MCMPCPVSGKGKGGKGKGKGSSYYYSSGYYTSDHYASDYYASSGSPGNSGGSDGASYDAYSDGYYYDPYTQTRWPQGSNGGPVHRRRQYVNGNLVSGSIHDQYGWRGMADVLGWDHSAVSRSEGVESADAPGVTRNAIRGVQVSANGLLSSRSE